MGTRMRRFRLVIVGVDITPICGPGTPPGVVAYLGLAAW